MEMEEEEEKKKEKTKEPRCNKKKISEDLATMETTRHTEADWSSPDQSVPRLGSGKTDFPW
ncbi:hypothetical protein N7517_006476 [Penicillium concentricum]|uniref:Uncharacterized protein n=1 Tax=Penicillium concentricum TaxID=293559 RepID=A0A9W9VCH2_9EURO|nr:uncharacterized protein N7517_006476 [Penicillium concentricum]KAJ5374470.1 hypothetical protein N7517_006476 [Penicillium concentricum]